MKKSLFIILLLMFEHTIYSQTASELIGMVQKAQKELKTVSYRLLRHDTLVTGDIRSMTGLVKMKNAENDSLFGCSFWAKQDGVNEETIYDDKAGFVINHNRKDYKITSKKESLTHFLYSNAGGQIVFTDLIKLDTANNTGFTVSQDPKYYYLTKLIPDLKEYDVFNRYTVFTIDKKLMLPVSMRSHQVSLGKVQDLNYEVKEIWVDDQSNAYDFTAQRFPAGYELEKDQMAQVQKQSSLLNKPLSPFQLVSIRGETVNSRHLKGKVILLDFLEVWCGPCFESAPKIQALYNKYKKHGLNVYGISFEKKQVDAMKRMVNKFNLDFPILIGDEAAKKNYEVEAIPKYIIINTKGDVSLVRIGFTEDLEKEIVKNLDL